MSGGGFHYRSAGCGLWSLCIYHKKLSDLYVSAHFISEKLPENIKIAVNSKYQSLAHSWHVETVCQFMKKVAIRDVSVY